MEQNIISKALESLEENLKIRGTWKEQPRLPQAERSIDGRLELDINGRRISLYVEIKREVRGYHIEAIRRLADHFPPLVVIAHKIFPGVKEQLRQQNIGYIETSGNLYLKHGDILIWVEGNKPVSPQKTQVNRAFTKTGLKVIFQFLRDEDSVNLSYRELASLCKVGLGNVNNIMNGLKEANFIATLGKNRYKLMNKKYLLEKWVMGYAERLQPTLEMGTFRHAQEKDALWKDIPLRTDTTLWGGEPAGALLTGYIKPSWFTLYTLETRTELVKNYRLLPDPQGNIRVYSVFWHHTPDGNTVPPLLVYTDLLNSNEPRCIETAEKIYNEYLKDKF